MKRGIAIAVAAAGLFGLFSIHLFEFTPTLAEKLVIVGVIVFVVLLIAIFEKKRPHRTAGELSAYMRNPARTRRKQWSAVRKTLEVVIPVEGDVRREARLRTELVIRNRKRRRLSLVELPLAGDSWVQEGDLPVSAKVAGKEAGVEIVHQDGHSPIVTLRLPAPGLARRDEIEISLSWNWPGLANMRGGAWVLGLIDLDTGGEACLRIDYPLDSPQIAQARVVRSLGGLQWDQELGSISDRKTDSALRYEYTYHRMRLDAYISVDMRSVQTPAAQPAPSP